MRAVFAHVEALARLLTVKAQYTLPVLTGRVHGPLCSRAVLDTLVTNTARENEHRRPK